MGIDLKCPSIDGLPAPLLPSNAQRKNPSPPEVCRHWPNQFCLSPVRRFGVEACQLYSVEGFGSDMPETATHVTGITFGGNSSLNRPFSRGPSRAKLLPSPDRAAAASAGRLFITGISPGQELLARRER